jgi:hypothetical protein
MALNKKQRRNIKMTGHIKAQEEPTAAKAKAFEEDYTELMTALNEKVEARMETFKSQAISMLREAYQARPATILNVIKDETDKINELIQAIMLTVKPISYPAFRYAAAECIKDLVDLCSNSIAEQYKRADTRNEVPLQ